MPAPVADFTGTPLSGTAGTNVTFTDSSTNTPTSWAWTFGDGGTSTLQNPTYQYVNPGLYSVSLTATNASGSNVKNRVGYVNITPTITDPLNGTGDQFTRADWKEFVQNQAPSTITGSAYDADAVVVGVVDFSKLFGAIRFALGYQKATSSAPYQLLRTDPVSHPKYDRLVCVAFDAQPIGPNGQLLKVAISPDPNGTDLRGYANYRKVLLTLKFKPRQFTFSSNPPAAENSSSEWTRYTISQAPKASLNVLSSQGFQMKWAEGPLVNADPLKTPAFPAPYGQLEPRLDFSFVWVRVPANYLLDGNGVPTKLLAGLGKVNSADWNGYPAGTLLCTGITLARYAWPWKAGSEDFFHYDVGFEMQYFDPPNGATSAYGYGGTASTVRGHNLRPSPAVPGTVPAGGAFPYYYATRVKADGTPSDAPLLPTSDFATMWDHVLA